MTRRIDRFYGTYAHFGDDVLQAIRGETFDVDIGQNSWLTVDEYDRFISWLRLTPGQRVLEVACGSGGPALYLARQAQCDVTGIDVSPEGVANAARQSELAESTQQVTFQVVDASGPLPFADDCFDALVCMDSMNHLAPRPAVLGEWRRVLRPGGRAVFTDPVVITGPVSNEELALRSSIGLFLFVPSGLNERLIEAAGLRLLQQEDVTANAALVAGRWYAARQRQRLALLPREGEERFALLQAFFAAVQRLSAERRLSRVAYLVEKPA